jgi:hypothetical protein
MPQTNILTCEISAFNHLLRRRGRRYLVANQCFFVTLPNCHYEVTGGTKCPLAHWFGVFCSQLLLLLIRNSEPFARTLPGIVYMIGDKGI